MRYLIVTVLVVLCAALVAAAVRWWPMDAPETPVSERPEGGAIIPRPNEIPSRTASDATRLQRLNRMRALVETDPNDVDAVLGLGDALFQLDRMREARKTFERAVTLDAMRVSGLYGLAACCRRQGDYAAELNAYREILRRRPGEPGLTARMNAAASALNPAGVRR